MTATTDIVQKLWSLCHVLRDDGITYLQYVTELTYLLFLKMMQETEQESQLPEGYRWGDLVSRDGVEQLTFYRAALLHLGSEGNVTTSTGDFCQRADSAEATAHSQEAGAEP
jgi:type I restriction enzyme M protein